jgi:hypothetical protein
VPQILNLRKTLCKQLVHYVGCSSAGPSFTQFVSEVTSLLPPRVRSEAVTASLECLAGRLITEDVLKMTMWRLAGNLELLARGDCIPPWTHQPYAEWVPAQILSALRHKTHRGKMGHIFTLVILAGLPAGLKVSKFWTDRAVRYIARAMGFARWPPGPRSSKPAINLLQNPTELVNMRLTIMIDPDLCVGEGPAFDRTKVLDRDVRFNKDQLKYRARRDPAHACPFSMPDAVPCFRCPKGTVSCRAATHPVDLEFRLCPTCHFDRAAFDPSVSTAMCLKCAVRDLLTRK